jgi:hypothetical protein
MVVSHLNSNTKPCFKKTPLKVTHFFRGFFYQTTPHIIRYIKKDFIGFQQFYRKESKAIKMKFLRNFAH